MFSCYHNGPLYGGSITDLNISIVTAQVRFSFLLSVSFSIHHLRPSRLLPLERVQPKGEASVSEGSIAQRQKGPWATLKPAFLWPSHYVR